MGDLCVAHLVRRTNEPEALQDFIASYIRHSAGEKHDLLLIFKGFSGSHQLAKYEPMLQGIVHQRKFVVDQGFDIGAYREIANACPYKYFAFFNSFSKITTPGWLAFMCRQLQASGVGAVGATASHQSILSDLVEMRASLRMQPKRLMLTLKRHARYFLSAKGRFPVYPNPHLRTNAFLVRREIFQRLHHPRAISKWDAYRFESGLQGMTRQLASAGLRTVVVGRDGKGYESSDWANSGTFWCAAQDNLLVEDNQTRAYANGSSALQERLAYMAWRRWPDGKERMQAPEGFFGPPE